MTSPTYFTKRLDTLPRGHRLAGFWKDPDRTKAWFLLYEIAVNTNRKAHPFIIKDPTMADRRWANLAMFAINRMMKMNPTPLLASPTQTPPKQ